jgi:hypothetical protein
MSSLFAGRFETGVRRKPRDYFNIGDIFRLLKIRSLDKKCLTIRFYHSIKQPVIDPSSVDGFFIGGVSS